MKKLIIYASLFFTAINIFAQNPFDAPENALWHETSGSWYVSSLGGGKVTLEEDNYGWISRLDANGKVITAKWVEGLHAPTGMAAVGNTLYAADRGRVAVIDISSAKLLKFIPLPGSQFVNDVAATSDGDVYISDTFTDRIYRLPKGGDPEVFIESSRLEYPNGLWVDGNTLIVATWGPMTDRTTFATSRPGTILKINMKIREISPPGKVMQVANLDGIVKYKKDYYATDWTGGRLLKIDPEGNVTEIMKGYTQLADLGIDQTRGVVMLVEMSSNRVFILKLE